MAAAAGASRGMEQVHAFDDDDLLGLGSDGGSAGRSGRGDAEGGGGRPSKQRGSPTPGESKGGDGSVPRYAMPNFSSILPDYSNAEADHVRAAFRTGNFVAISRLPAQLKPNGINVARQQAMQSNIRIGDPTADAAAKQTTHPVLGTFSTFEYIPSRYSLADELARKERLEAEAKRLAVGGKDFVCAGTGKKLKYEDGFEDKEFRYPYLGDPYAAAQDQVMRAKWIEDSKILHGPFVPSGREHALAAPVRSALPDILTELRRVLDQDWNEYSFSVISTEDDIIVVRFALDTVDCPKGLQAYMNVLAQSGDVAMKYSLTRVIEDWHSQPGDGFLYYMLRPPWVRARLTDTYFTLHPEERSYSTSLAAGLTQATEVARAKMRALRATSAEQSVLSADLPAL